MRYSVCAVICAAGKGLRAGFNGNKLLASLSGEPVIKKTVTAFDFPAIDEIIIAVSQTDYEEISALCQAFPRTKVVLGGETRARSVYNSLRETTADIVLIHDGARPFVSREIIQDCIHSVKTYGSGVCAVECKDTIAVVSDEKITDVPTRANLRQIQTPQGFFRENIAHAYELAFLDKNANYTDDSSVFARYCGQPRICKGSVENTKLTYANDFDKKFRCGFGVDTHAFGKPQNYILLAGVKIPSDSGLIAHSDGDVLAHAVMDALLSAAGLRDIGFYFPDNNEKWKNADSMQMLSIVLSLLNEKGFVVENLSIAIQAEKPRLAKYIEEIKSSLAGALKLDPTRIGVGAGTNEGLGYVGEGKGITVNAYVLIKEK